MTLNCLCTDYTLLWSLCCRM